MTHLDICRDMLATFCEQWIRQAWQQVDERLCGRAGTLAAPAAANRMIAVIQEIRFRAEGVRSHMARRINENFELFGRSEPNPPTPGDDARDAPEEALALAGIVANAGENCQRELWQLHKRLAVLRGGLPVTDDESPCSPVALCNAFRDAVATVDVDIRVRLAIYEAFGRVFQREAGELYRELNQYLVDAGVLANLRFAVITGGGDDAPADEQPGRPGERRRAVSGQDTALYAELCTLLRQAQPQLANDVPGFRQLLTGCVQVQRTIAGKYALGPEEPIDAEIVQRLIALHSHGDAGSNQYDLEARLRIVLMGRIFAWLGERTELPQATRSVLSALHAPYLKLAVLDAGFFTSPTHPARQLLDLVANEHAHYWASAPRWEMPLKAIHDTVRELALDLSESIASIDHRFQLLREQLLEARGEARRNSEREVRAQEGMAHLLQAQREAILRWQALVREHAITAEANNLLQAPMGNFLSFAWLRYGAGTRPWRVALRLAQGVAVSVRGHRVPVSIDRYRRGQFRVLALIKRSLTLTGYDGILTRDLRDAIYRAQVIAARELTAGRVETPQAAAEMVEPDTASGDLGWLSVGACYRVGESDEAGRRVQLAWKSDNDDLFLFTLANGEKFRLFDTTELGRLVNRGSLRAATPHDPAMSTTALGAVRNELQTIVLRDKLQGAPTDHV